MTYSPKFKMKLGRPPKLKRNLLICKLRDEGMLLKELAEMFNMKHPTVIEIIQKTWKEYIRWKKSGDNSLLDISLHSDKIEK